MPLYEYECDACKHRFEKIQKFSDALEDTCPKCGGVVHKLMSSPAIQFKGSGFYINDYARKDQPGASKTEDSDKSEGSRSEGGQGGSGKTEATQGGSGKSEGSQGGGGKSDKTEKTGRTEQSGQSSTSS